MAKHIHAELMLQYAQDAMETSEPWLQWEAKHHTNKIWEPCCHTDMHFAAFLDYRRKPKMLSVTLANGEVVNWPEPVRNVKFNQRYWVPIHSNKTLQRFKSTDDDYLFEYGVCHLTKEAAEQHAAALLKINNQGLEP